MATTQTATSYRVQSITSNWADIREGRNESEVLESIDFDTLEEATAAYNNICTGMEVDKQLLAVYPMTVGEHTEVINTTY